MNETVSLDQLPPQVESLLRAVWEENESLVLERNRKHVAVIVPMDEYRKLQSAEGENFLAYKRSVDLLDAYHELTQEILSRLNYRRRSRVDAVRPTTRRRGNNSTARAVNAATNHPSSRKVATES